jgi:N-acetylneuraminic acid mutarotase
MRPGSLLTALLLWIGYVFNSCAKEYSCEHCLEKNKPPVANAGPDQSLVLPADSTLLDGKASKDPDGFIVSYKWRLITVNTTAIIAHPDSAITSLKGLGTGMYDVVLKVTDNQGLSDEDTIQVRVNISSQIKQPPVARAGDDQTYTTPVNSITLDGSQSYDPDGSIVSYSWRQIAGSNQSGITDPSKAVTMASNMTGDSYQFELTVTDNDALISKDTMQVFVTTPLNCTSNRPIINATLVPVENLSFQALGALAATAGNKILFIGGFYYDPFMDYLINPNVLIYDFVTHTWTAHQLNITRQGMSVTTSGNKIYIAGGYDPAIAANYSVIDIYDALSDTWTTAELSEARSNVCSVTLGDQIFFAGGSRWVNDHFEPSDKVDILNTATGTWTIASLSEPRGSAMGNVVVNKIYFAGGRKADNNISDRIDIYDGLSNSWSSSNLHEGKLFFASAATKGNIYWAGGITANPGVQSQEVEIRDVMNQTSTFSCLSKPMAGLNAVQKGDDIIFFPGYPSWNVNENSFDIYNTVTKTWSIGKLNTNISNAAIIVVGDNIYVAGGNKSDTEVSPQVSILKW